MVTFREKWTKKFAGSLNDDERKAFRLWLAFSDGRISESEFKKKMEIKVMPKMLGKMSAARINALEEEIEKLRKRMEIVERKLP